MKISKQNSKYIIFITVILLVNALFFVWYLNKGKQSESMLDKIQKGDILFDGGKYDQALIIYDEILKIQPDNKDAIIRKGQSLVNLGRYNEAIDYYYKASRFNSNFEPVYKGLILLNTSKNLNSLDYFNSYTGVELKQKSDTMQLLKCGFLYNINKFEESSICLDRLFVGEPNNPWGNYLKAMSLQKNKDYLGSIKFFDIALAAGYYNSEIFYNKGVSFNKTNNLSGAIENYQKALSLSGYHVNSLLDLSKIYYNQQNYEKSLEYIEQVLMGNQSNSDALALKGMIYYKLKQYQFAIDSFQKAYDSDLINTDFLANKALAYYKFKNLTGATQTINEAITKVPLNIHRYTQLGIILSRIGNYQQSLVYLDKALKIDKHKLAWFAKGYTYSKMGDINKSLEYYRLVFGAAFTSTDLSIIDVLYLYVNEDYYAAYTKYELNVSPQSNSAEYQLIKLYLLEKLQKKSDYDKLMSSLATVYPQLKYTKIKDLVYEKFGKYLDYLEGSYY